MIYYGTDARGYGASVTIIYGRDVQEAAATAIVDWYKAYCPLWFWAVY